MKQYEYYRVAIQQETEERMRHQARATLRQQQLQAMTQQPHHPQPKSPHTPRLQQHFNYPPPPSHMPHPQPHPPYGGGGVTSSGAYFDHRANPHPHHDLNNLQHHYPSSSPAMFSTAVRHHSSANLQQQQHMVGGVSGYHGNLSARPVETGAPNRTQSYNNLPHLPSNGHMVSGQLHLKTHTSAGSTFADFFESKVSHLQDLEETFV